MYYIKINKLIKQSKQRDIFSKNDLYVKINYLENNIKLNRTTNIIYNNNEPIWNEIFILENPETIDINLYEKGNFKDKLINNTILEKNINGTKKTDCNNIEIYHGYINIENKEVNDRLIQKNKELNNKLESLNSIIKEKNNLIQEFIEENIENEKKINNLTYDISLCNKELQIKTEIINNIKNMINI